MTFDGNWLRRDRLRTGKGGRERRSELDPAHGMKPHLKFLVIFREENWAIYIRARPYMGSLAAGGRDKGRDCWLE